MRRDWKDFSGSGKPRSKILFVLGLCRCFAVLAFACTVYVYICKCLRFSVLLRVGVYAFLRVESKIETTRRIASSAAASSERRREGQIPVLVFPTCLFFTIYLATSPSGVNYTLLLLRKISFTCITLPARSY